MKWENIRTKIAVKTAGLILVIVFLMILIASITVIAYNLSEGNYSKDVKQMQKSIDYEIAFAISNDIMNGKYDGIDPTDAGFGFIKTKKLESGKEKVLEKEITKELEKKPHYEFEHTDVTVTVMFDWDTLQQASEEYNSGQEYVSRYALLYKVYAYRNIAIAAAILSAIFFIALVIMLLCAAGWTKEGLKANAIDRIPLELLCVLCLPVLFVGINVFVPWYYNGAATLLIYAGVLILVAALAEVLCMSFATRVKLGKWWRNTILYFIWKQIKKIGKGLAEIGHHLPMLWKVVLLAGANGIIWLVLILGAQISYGGGFVFLGVLFAIVQACALLYFSIGLQKLRTAGEKLAAGELDYKVDKRGLYLDFADHADHLNRIGEGMSQAIEARMKSERFKTELITNVSHDIKTPLTSIINYVDLLKKEDVQEENVKDYIEVLDRQSHRLKKLSEDLIDASKAATGAVKINLAPCQVGVLMTQTLGEYEERLQAENLTVISSIPEDDVTIMADGRQLWRVFDNLLGNICKYSQQGTRVYIDLYEEAGSVFIIYKNISKYELNTKGEVFLERFMRGDRSRHTEGSGLGLSIAQSLVNLQHGSLNIEIDGDLFKVIIRFNQQNSDMKKEAKKGEKRY